ncbi:hypothetical protein ES707_09939 [subsurface metagenome]
MEQSESVLWSGRPSHLYFCPAYILGLCLIPLYGVGLLLIVLAVLRQLTTRYQVTAGRVVARAGIIGRQRREVLLADVLAVELRQGVIGRLVGIGNVHVATAATGGVEIDLSGVRRPAEVLAIIRRQTDGRRRGGAE